MAERVSLPTVISLNAQWTLTYVLTVLYLIAVVWHNLLAVTTVVARLQTKMTHTLCTIMYS